MNWLRQLLARQRMDHDLSVEMEQHLEEKIEALMATGMPRSEATFAAHRQFGNLLQLQERSREVWQWPRLESILADLRYGLRQLRQSPGFAATAVLTLALGIGATTAIFTLVHAVLLQSLPVARPDQLYRVGDTDACCVLLGFPNDYSLFSYPFYRYLKQHTTGFAELAAFQVAESQLAVRRSGRNQPARPALGEFVSGNYFSMFGIRPFLGRTLAPSDDQTGAPRAAVMSYQTWQQDYGHDPSVIGASFGINGSSFTVVGVAPPGFFGDNLRSDPPDFWIPISAQPVVDASSPLLDHPDLDWLDLIGRIQPGANPATINAEINVEMQQLLRQYAGTLTPDEQGQLSRVAVHLSPGGAGISNLRDQYRDGLRLLMIVAGLVLLIACANIANLLLARGLSRRQQTCVRMALGAPSSRLIRQSLTESLLLALLGGIAGLALAYAGSRLIVHYAVPSGSFVPIRTAPSLPVLAFAFLVSCITGVLFGLAPAWITSRSQPGEALRGASRLPFHSAGTPQKALIALQAALSLALLSVAGMLTLGLRHLERQNFGFQTSGRLIVRIDPALAGYKPEQLATLYRSFRNRLARIPGAMDVSYSLFSPMEGQNWSDEIFIGGHPHPASKDTDYFISWDRIGPRYFETVGTGMLRGRTFGEQDTATSTRVAVVNRSFARKFFPGQDPIGQHFGTGDSSHSDDIEIVGVVRDAKYVNPNQPVQPMFFVPFTQTVASADPAFVAGQTRSLYAQDIEIHFRGAASSIEPQIRRELAGIDPNLTIARMLTLPDQLDANFAQPELVARLTSLFGILALLLAGIGLYGVTAYSVARRAIEIGIRMALGADRGSVLSFVLRGALFQVGLGLLAGIPLSIAAGYAMSSQLYGVKPFSPAILAATMALLLTSALVAALIPARHAASTDPMLAFRSQ